MVTLSEAIPSTLPNARVLVDNDKLKSTVRTLARTISQDYADKKKDLAILVIMNGAYMFAADLLRQANLHEAPQYFIRAKSYNGTESIGAVSVTGEKVIEKLKDKHVLIVEDIVDTGRTVDRIKDLIDNKVKTKSVKVVTLIDKPKARKADFKHVRPEYVGITTEPDKFVLGYGLDHDDRYRSMPFIAYLHKPPH